MMIPTGFIEVTSLIDGKRFLIRVDSIDAVYENDPKSEKYGGKKPACTTVVYGNCDVDIAESYDEVLQMMWKSDL